MDIDRVDPRGQRAAHGGAEPIKDVLDLLGAQRPTQPRGVGEHGGGRCRPRRPAVGTGWHDPTEARGEVRCDQPASRVDSVHGGAHRCDVPVMCQAHRRTRWHVVDVLRLYRLRDQQARAATGAGYEECRALR